MAEEPNDPRSSGVTADDADQPQAPGVPGADPDDIARHHTGRWTSPSLGAYDPMAGHQALESSNGADDAYFEQFGYGEGYGDGRLAAGYDPAPVRAPDEGDRAGGPPPYELNRSVSAAEAAAETGAIAGRVDHRAAERDGRLADRTGPVGPAHGGLDGADRGMRPDVGPTAFDGDDGHEPGEDVEDGLDAASDARRNVIEWAVVLVGAVLLALILRALVLQAFWIPSPSMESTLLVRDRVLVNKVSYRVGDIGRGDIIVFRRTDDEIASNPELPRDVIKRVIALGGETIEIVDDQVFIDGQLLREPYLDDGVITTDYGPEVVPEGHVFVMGDNRELSLDSRFETGPIAEDRVVGRAFFLFWPLSRVGSL